MKVYSCGFNLYGQFAYGEELVINSFTEFTYESLSDIAINHAYSVVKIDGDVLLHGAVGNETHKTVKIAAVNARNIRAFCCSDNRVLLLNEEGNIYKCDLRGPESLQAIPSLLESEDVKNGDYITHLACGSKITVAVSKCGRIFNVPNKLEFVKDGIKQVVCGREHCLLLDNVGNVYSFGMGSRGQLGHGALTNENEPKLVEQLGGIKIVKVSAGSWHSVAVSESGDVYSWGWNGNGQLGLSSETAISVLASPQLVEFPNALDSMVVDIACGSKHTIMLLGDNKVLGMGWNKYRQLGDVADENVYPPTCLQEFTGENVVGLRCGPWCSAVLVK